MTASRFVIKFKKDGYIKYISHLDLMRVFRRTFMVQNIELKYSMGYNPHPKMSFAQPLSLGYSSDCELLEFETAIDYPVEIIRERMSTNLPLGIDVIDVFRFNSDCRSLAGETVSAEYEIYFPKTLPFEEIKRLLDSYLDRDSIITLKRMKKTKEKTAVEIRQMIQDIKLLESEDSFIFDCLLDQGSQSNLSPELVISSFIEHAGLKVERYEIDVKRVNIGFSDKIDCIF